MRVFLIASDLPNPGGEAVHIVLDEAIRGLRAAGHEVVYQRVLRQQPASSQSDQALLDRLVQAGIQVEPLLCPTPAPSAGGWPALLKRVRRLLAPEIQDLYPEILLKDALGKRLARTKADVLFIFWSQPGLAASFGLKAVPKFVYYGMPDHATGEARFRQPEFFDIPHRRWADKLRLMAWRRENRKRREFHIRMMLDCDTVGNLCAVHARMYAEAGHPRSLYLQNMWPDSTGQRWQDLRLQHESEGRWKLLANVGNLQSTGNTFGLHYLGTKILPLLQREIGKDGFEVHLCGQGWPSSRVAQALRFPEVRWRGWVQDIDAEILSSQIFLIMNNAGVYRGAHTRFLHAWSLGSCVVAHAESVRAMPEIRHLENALVGETPEEIAAWVKRALQDGELRRRIGEGGRRTYEQHHTPGVVVGRILIELERLAGLEQSVVSAA